jgi:hypothetical protein
MSEPDLVDHDGTKMSPTRRAFSFSVATCLLVAGLYLLLVVAAGGWVADRPAKFRFIVIGSCAGLIFVGVCWLWADFIGPALRRKILSFRAVVRRV